jgi:endoribonuclease Dicer
MHVARQRIISNRSLLQRAREADVPQYIQSKPFIPKLWIPYNYKFTKRIREPVASHPPDGNLNLGDFQLEEPASGSQKRGPDDALEEGELFVSEPQEQDEAQEGPPEPIPQEVAEEAGSRPIVSRPSPPKPRKRGEDTRVQWLGDKVRMSMLLEQQALN